MSNLTDCSSLDIPPIVGPVQVSWSYFWYLFVVSDKYRIHTLNCGTSSGYAHFLLHQYETPFCQNFSPPNYVSPWNLSKKHFIKRYKPLFVKLLSIVKSLKEFHLKFNTNQAPSFIQRLIVLLGNLYLYFWTMSLQIANSQLPFIQSGRFAKSLSSFNSETVFSFLEVGGVIWGGREGVQK